MKKHFYVPVVFLFLTTIGSFLGLYYIEQTTDIDGDKMVTESVIQPLKNEVLANCSDNCDKLISALEIMEVQNKAKIDFAENTFSLWFKFNIHLLVLSIIFGVYCYGSTKT